VHEGEGESIVKPLRSAFSRQLQDLDREVIVLFAMLAEDIVLVTDVLLDAVDHHDVDIRGAVAEREAIINDRYLEIESLVNLHIACQAPVAGDLRQLVSTLRVVPEMERAHDLVTQIAALAAELLGSELSPRLRGQIQAMGDTAARMWLESGEAWHRRDGSALAQVAAYCRDMDSLKVEIRSELLDSPGELTGAIRLTVAAHCYNRLGHHALNVARRIVYLSGDDARRPAAS
jgi:phosphate transport system protein